MRVLFVLLLFISVTACSNTDIEATATFLQENPPTIPDFIYVYPDGYSSPVGCIEIDQTAVWEEGDTIESLQEHLRGSIQVTMDDSIVLLPEESIASFHLSGGRILDENDNWIASTGGPVMVCADKERLAPGLHIATVNFTSTSGKPYAYTWTFEVE